MSKPCETIHPGYHPGCRLCWLARNSGVHAEEWGTEIVETPDEWWCWLDAYVPGPDGTPPARRVTPYRPCRHEGAVLEFSTCGGEAAHVRGCDVFDRCVRDPGCGRKVKPGVGVCKRCRHYQPEVPAMRWSYGITTVPNRRDDLLPRTLASLKAAGFDHPRLFVDGCTNTESWASEFGLPVSGRPTRLSIFGNFILALWELYVLDPAADRYALFQDDILISRGARGYLDRCHFPQRGYWNLHTVPQNERLAPKGTHGWFVSNCRGRGALGLVFDLAGVQYLLSNSQIVGRPRDGIKGKRNVDGAVAHAMNRAGADRSGFLEYCHVPSIVQHNGNQRSAMGNKPQPMSETFRGEQFDLTTLLEPVVTGSAAKT